MNVAVGARAGFLEFFPLIVSDRSPSEALPPKTTRKKQQKRNTGSIRQKPFFWFLYSPQTCSSSLFPPFATVPMKLYPVFFFLRSCCSFRLPPSGCFRLPRSDCVRRAAWSSLLFSYFSFLVSQTSFLPSASFIVWVCWRRTNIDGSAEQPHV